MGTEQFYFTANLGFDGSFGDKWRSIGLFTGPVLFMRPKQESEPFALSGTPAALCHRQGLTPPWSRDEYNNAQADEDELNRYAFG